MKAAVFQKPRLVTTETVANPKLTSPTDAIVKVKYSGLCGSDLHYYRGHIPLKQGQIMGHEFVGTITELGSEVTGFKVGDDVISTFTIQCGECWYCQHGYSGTCAKTNTFGKVGLHGAQAEYVLVPYAASTLVHKPQTPGSDELYVLMADIFVTGYFGVKKILNHFSASMSQSVAPLTPDKLTVLQLGAGPVGLCAVRILRHFGFTNIVVVDSIDERLDAARSLGASVTVNFLTEPTKLQDYIANSTDGNGFDAALEIVGASAAMRTAFDSVRRNGFVSSVGMGHDAFPFDALEAYAKSVTISFGRCHAWSLFHEALDVFELVKEDLAALIAERPSIEESQKYYELFEAGKVGKVVFHFTEK